MNPLAQRLRAAGILLILGLAVTIGSLVWETPLSFLICIAIGGALIFAGIVVYLYSLISSSTAQGTASPGA